MALISEKMTASSIEVVTYNENYEVTARTYPTGATFTLTTRGSKYGSNISNATLQEATFCYPITSSQYVNKKRLAEKENYITVKTASLSHSGNMPTGDSPALKIDEYPGVFEYDLSNNSYNETLVKTDNAFYINSDLTAGIKTGSTGVFYSNVSYSQTGTATIYGITDATRAPYTMLYWADIIPKINGTIPTAGAFVNEKADNVFSWAVNMDKTGSGSYLNYSAVLKWRVKGSTTEHTINAGTNATSATIPANTLPTSGEIEYCIIATTSEGNSNAPEWITITTTDEIPGQPTETRPNTEAIDGNTENVFSWVHNDTTGTAQTKADLQYSTNGSTWYALGTVNGPVTRFIVPADTLPAGQIYWRVRTYNSDNQPGDYSEPAVIIVRAKPPRPSINSVDGKPFATVTWGSVDQMGYRVIFTDSTGKTYDTGEQYGAIKTATCKMRMADGPASVIVKVGNGLGRWNETEAEFTVRNVPGESFSVDFERDPYSVKFLYDGMAFIERDGVLIGSGANEYTDNAGNGTAIYNVVKVSNGYYTKSRDIELTFTIKTAVIIDVETGEAFNLNIRQGAPVSIAKSKTASVSYNEFAGAEKPTAYYSGHKTETVSIPVTRSAHDLNIFEKLLGKTVILKDKTGAVLYAVLTGIGENVEYWNDITLEFTATEEGNGVLYEL